MDLFCGTVRGTLKGRRTAIGKAPHESTAADPEQAAARQSCLKKPSAIQLMGSLRSNRNHSE